MDLVDDVRTRTLARLGEEETIWAAAGALRAWGGALRGTAGTVRRLEESLPAPGHGAGTVARRRAGDAVRADVREAGDRADRGEFAAGERAGGGETPHASGPAGEEAAAETDQEPRPSESVPGGGVSGGTQRAVWAGAAARRRDYHRRAPGSTELDRIFRVESERTISEDWVARYENRFSQLEPESRNYAPAKGKVVVWEKPEARNRGIEYRGRAVRWGRRLRRRRGRLSQRGATCHGPENREAEVGCRRRITLGERQRGDRWKGTRPGSAGGGRGACPPLRPRRSPCGSQGFAPAKPHEKVRTE